MKTYPLTPQQFSALRTRLLELGITLPDDEFGEILYRGIELHYNYNGKDTLTLSIHQKPFLLSQSLIWGKVDEWLHGLA